MLVPYSATIFFPGGNRAVNTAVGVRMLGSNVLPLIFTDSGGAFPAPNPFMTDGNGFLTFFASPGLYLSRLAGTEYPIPVDPGYVPSVWPDVFVHAQAVPASVWTVNHFFGTHPGVSVVSAGAEVEAQVDHPSMTQTVITFGVPTTGTAYLRR
jgi:hypothetical protein